MPTTEIKTDLANGIMTVTLSRPDKKNALTNAMYRALADVIERAHADNDVRVLLIQADADTFTAGNDVAEFAAQALGNGPSEQHVVRFLHHLANASIPVVAAVQGKAVGIGTTLLLHCDYVILADDAQLITPFVNLALIPEAASSYLLPLRIGHVRAFEMFSLGAPLPAATALAWGIANQVVPLAQLRDAAQQIARTLSAKPRGSLATMKRLMREAEKLVAQIDREGEVFVERMASAEAKEAFVAFAQKRPPDFTKIAQR